MIALDPCPRCGSNPAPGSPGGLCARCLLGGILEPISAGSTTTGAGVLETLSLSAGPLPRVLLRDTEVFNGPGPMVRPGSEEMPALAARSGRLQLFGEIARGGMGAVLKGRDTDLGRDLAVKVLLEKHGDDAGLTRRFVEEAQIAGQLQHPGVVPVYELGAFADQRPYFAMKLVKGRTLAEVLSDRARPSDDHPRLLAIFLDVAQTMAYAHARGVIHRDLKPSNVMVGSFGEVQVMDWGLAKVLARGGAVDDREAGKLDVHETVIATARSGGSGSDLDLSHAGSVLGTPSYMAPEQARGENDHLDERADVFALGSILCEMLTGQPAFSGRTTGEILRKAARGDVAEALSRLDASGAEPGLVALARETLAAEADDRLCHAGAVVDRLNRHHAGVQQRLRDAELAQAAESARAEEALHTAEESRRAAEAAEARAKAEGRARRLTVALAASVLGIAAVGGLGATAYYQQRAAKAAATARALGDAEALLARAERHPDDPSGWREARAAVLRVAAESPGDESAQARASRARSRAEAGLQAAELDAALLDELASIRAGRRDAGDAATDVAYGRAFRKAGLDVDALAPDEAAARIRRRSPSRVAELASYLDDWTIVRYLAGVGGIPAGAPLRVVYRADPDPFRNKIREGVADPPGPGRDRALRALVEDPRVGEVPAGTATLLCRAIDDPPRVVAFLRRAVLRHPDDVWLNFDLAEALAKLGESSREEAIRYYSAARALRPDTAHALAHLLVKSGREAEAEAIFRDLIARRPDNSGHLYCLGNHLKGRGRVEEAAPMFAAAEAINRRELARYPDDPNTLLLRANELFRRRDYAGAERESRQLLRLKPDSSQALILLGASLENLGKRAEAALAYRKVLEINPDNADAHCLLGRVLVALDRVDQGAAEMRAAIRLNPGLALAHTELASVLARRGKVDEARAEHREAIRLEPYDAYAHRCLGRFLEEEREADEAADELRLAVRLDPDEPDGHHFLGHALEQQGKLDEALAEYRTTLKVARPGFRYATEVSRHVDTVGLMIAAAPRLPAILKGAEAPRDARDGLALARLCSHKGLHEEAARLAQAAFALNPGLADDLKEAHRYEAACRAAQAGSVRSRPGPTLDEAAHAGLRARALGWLRADLALRSLAVAGRDRAARADAIAKLARWKSERDFALVREPEGLARLPEAERAAWEALWAEVDELIVLGKLDWSRH